MGVKITSNYQLCARKVVFVGHSTNPAESRIIVDISSPFARSFPAISTSENWHDRVVCQGHADYCAENGHASHTIDGIVQPRCPRCGDLREDPEPEDSYPLVTSPLTHWMRYAETHVSWVARTGDSDDWHVGGDQLALDFGGSLPRTSVIGESTLWEKVSA